MHASKIIICALICIYLTNYFSHHLCFQSSPPPPAKTGSASGSVSPPRLSPNVSPKNTTTKTYPFNNFANNTATTASSTESGSVKQKSTSPTPPEAPRSGTSPFRGSSSPSPADGQPKTRHRFPGVNALLENQTNFDLQDGVHRSRRSGRKLATRKERMQLERLRSQQIRDHSVTAEEFEKVFSAYAAVHEVANIPALKPVHFSAIWRMVSGEKGNLFKEMQSFQK